ncbi:MAG: zinc dependent phospholipase C family protein [Clostridiales bacterium]|nr:zinc dependent phospholipase C family protein [Clostridiales bacterium]
MPSTYTHYAYGQKIFRMLKPDLQKRIQPYMDYYNIGVHGPDILFYYRAYSKNKINQYGVQVHNEPMHDFLVHAFDVYESQQRKAEAFAYLAGFMTHFILDSSCHPYVNKRIRETGITHTEIETDWDYLMMKQDGLSPLHYRAARHIKPKAVDSSVIAPYYGITAKQTRTSLVHMRFILNHLFHSHFGLKRAIVRFVENHLSPKSEYQYFFRKDMINSQDKKTCNGLYRHYKDCEMLCVKMITEMAQALAEDDRSFCEKERFRGNFS